MDSPDSNAQPERFEHQDERRLARMLFWIGFGVGVAALGAALGYTALRLVSSGRQDDPTTQRIQQLIDEANSLLKALDEQRNSA
jgi:hypothetical protein